MNKKYYGYFVYDDEDYVIRFKTDGGLRWSKFDRAFITDDYYVYSPADVISYAALGTMHNDKKFYHGICYLIPHETFVRYRSEGIKRWNPKNEVIRWGTCHKES